MKHHSFISLVTILLTVACSSVARANDSQRRLEAFLIQDFLWTPDGVLDNACDLIYDLDPCDPANPDALAPVLAPDGHPVVLGEYDNAKGHATIKCGKKGTQVEMKLSGLLPNGVYTIWLLTFKAPGLTPDMANIIGEGSLGPADGSQNSFRASDKGKATLKATVPAGNLSEFGSVGSCLFDEFAFLLAGVYHPDGKTYGPFPGPQDAPNPFCFFVEHFGFAFTQGDAGKED